ncbi:hypothetical protein ABGN05_07700 [Aquibium sp. LZ166]|uniref:Uncharacterized protein n=1 Tax=Aquibium pacificus TaxID=3153579 RepID=A0ABV3SFK5_9HYPH
MSKEQVAAVRRLLPSEIDPKQVEEMVGRFNHYNGSYQFHRVRKKDKALAGNVRRTTDRLIALIFKGELTPFKAKLATRYPPVTRNALESLSEFALSIETEALANTPSEGTGNVDRTDRRLAIYFAKQLLDLSPPPKITIALIARVAASLNGEIDDETNYRPLVAKAMKHGAI